MENTPQEHKTHTVHHQDASHEEHKQHATHHGHKNESSLDLITIILALVLGIVVIANVYLAYSIMGVQPKVIPAPPIPKIELTTITTDCSECKVNEQAIASLKGKYNVTKENSLASDSEKAEELIVKYGIKKLPTFIVSGDIQNVTDAGFTKADDALVFNDVKVPYFDPETDEIIGKVDVTYLLVKECKTCANMSLITEQLKQSGVVIGKVKSVELSSSDGKKLAEKYNVTKAPTVLFSESAKEYEVISAAWSTVGSIEKDGTHVLRLFSPPYFDVKEDRIRGTVFVTLLNDTSCEKCYDVNIHKMILSGNFGMKFDEPKIVDASSDEGEELLEKYGIKAVPTFIVEGDVEAYEQLAKIWPTVGTVDDGAYVFRELGVLGMTYMNLSTGKLDIPVVKNETASTE